MVGDLGSPDVRVDGKADDASPSRERQARGAGEGAPSAASLSSTLSPSNLSGSMALHGESPPFHTNRSGNQWSTRLPRLCSIDTTHLCGHPSAMHRAVRIAARRRRRLLTGVEGLRTR
jgi:hypothetical protein